MEADYYKILDVSKDASTREIRRRFCHLAFLFHPDVTEGDPAEIEKFNVIKTAYETLISEEKKRDYDRRISVIKKKPDREWAAYSRAPFPTAVRGSNEVEEEQDYPVYDATIYNESKIGSHDRNLTIALTLERAVRGASYLLSEQSDNNNKQGPFYKVRIPSGMWTGAMLKVKGLGFKDKSNGTRGDLLIRIELKPHRHFQVYRHHLSYDLWLDPWDAALGGAVMVPTLEGEEEVLLESGISDRKHICIENGGLFNREGKRGDLNIRIMISVKAPKTKEERELWDKLAELSYQGDTPKESNS